MYYAGGWDGLRQADQSLLFNDASRSYGPEPEGGGPYSLYVDFWATYLVISAGTYNGAYFAGYVAVSPFLSITGGTFTSCTFSLNGLVQSGTGSISGGTWSGGSITLPTLVSLSVTGGSWSGTLGLTLGEGCNFTFAGTSLSASVSGSAVTVTGTLSDSSAIDLVVDLGANTVLSSSSATSVVFGWQA